MFGVALPSNEDLYSEATRLLEPEVAEDPGFALEL